MSDRQFFFIEECCRWWTDHVRDGCVSAIGLHSREIISDDQFSASSSASSQYAPSAARINDDAGYLLYQLFN